MKGVIYMDKVYIIVLWNGRNGELSDTFNMYAVLSKEDALKCVEDENLNLNLNRDRYLYFDENRWRQFSLEEQAELDKLCHYILDYCCDIENAEYDYIEVDLRK